MRRVSINRVSKRRKKENEKYLVLRKIYLELNPVCEAQAFGCSYFANQIHHKKLRYGKYLTDTEWFMAVCGSCHTYINDNGVAAKERGWKL